LDDQFEKNETDGVCSKYGGQERCIKGFGGKILIKETRHRWKDYKLDHLRKWDGGMEWIDLAQDRDR
jgi:hypothetical protein